MLYIGFYCVTLLHCVTLHYTGYWVVSTDPLQQETVFCLAVHCIGSWPFVRRDRPLPPNNAQALFLQSPVHSATNTKLALMTPWGENDVWWCVVSWMYLYCSGVHCTSASHRGIGIKMKSRPTDQTRASWGGLHCNKPSHDRKQTKAAARKSVQITISH